MIELPEAVVLAKQVNETLTGKRVRRVVAAQTPHRFAWYHGDPWKYNSLLAGKTVGNAVSRGGMVEISLGDAKLVFGDEVGMRYYGENEKPPGRHQLWVEFEDASHLVARVQMYGGLWAFPGDSFNNKYYLVAGEKPSPLTAGFGETYFNSLFKEDAGKLSLKAFLATEQRIPGLGNGVLQDIMLNARMHPKKRVDRLTEKDRKRLFSSIKRTLAEMVAGGGRDTETDLYGRPGGYRTILSRNTVGKPCPVCGETIVKEAYLGGSIYYCSRCQET
ncbi:MAG: zinc finger domain-containing protein [Thermoproteota archaeon]